MINDKLETTFVAIQHITSHISTTDLSRDHISQWLGSIALILSLQIE